MSKFKSDPLLNSARILIGFLMGICAFAGGAVVLGVGAILTVQRQDLVAKLAAEGIPANGVNAILAILILVAAVMALGFFFLRHLLRIIGSVGEGDPFNPVNADRLRSMGWLAIASQPVMWTLGLVAHWIEQFTDKAHTEVGISLGAIILGLILFILARVFRTGAAMREELEGTV
ncbi:DUF2975 domain-containing protein [Sphingomonas jaspsi]|uniref:DUF2975 domain-containing protein n=1 Tax=Sphingomonas jaspsi TaxID=392409 RepID=UPI0004B52684|nr:DUF2975 domain-containing protein [Sphingomonas jaspsi]